MTRPRAAPSLAGLEPDSKATDVLYLGTGGHTNPSLATWIASGDHVTVAPAAVLSRGYSVYSLAASPSGTRLAAGTRAGLMQVYALEKHRPPANAKPIFEMFHGKSVGTGVCGLAFVTDDILASGGDDGHIRLWDVAQRRCVTQIEAHDGGVLALCSLGSLVLASIGSDGLPRVWDLDDVELRFTGERFSPPPRAALTSLDFDAHSGYLMHGSGDGCLHAYDTRREFNLRKIQAHRGGFCALACGSNFLATAGYEDLTLKFWPQSLEEPTSEIALTSRPTALGWTSCDCLAIVDEDGSVERRRTTGVIQAEGNICVDHVRTCVGLPARVLSDTRTSADRAWRDDRVSCARQLMAQSGEEACQQVRIIISELHSRGFCVESVLLVAELARTQKRPLWELETLMTLVREMGDVRAAVPCLFAIGELLERMKEPELAVDYFKRAYDLDSEYVDVGERIDELRSHPLWALSPDDCVRADFYEGRLVLPELEKHTILDRKFTWRSVVKSTAIGRVPGHVNLNDIQPESRAGAPQITKTALVTNNEQRTVNWSFGPGCETIPGLYFALEAVDRVEETAFRAYAVFDPAGLAIGQDASAEEYNQCVRDSWMHVQASSEARPWFGASCRRASLRIRQATVQTTSRY